MRLERIFARQRSKYRPMTTDSRHGGPIAPNRLRALVVRRPNQVWATDVTCVLTAQGWLYLVAVLDIFSRRVIGWAMSQLLDTSLVSAALRMAINQRHYSHNLILHSESRSPVRQRRLPATARPTRPNRFDESKRQLLG
jgi:putative transposase